MVTNGGEESFYGTTTFNQRAGPQHNRVFGGPYVRFFIFS